MSSVRDVCIRRSAVSGWASRMRRRMEAIEEREVPLTDDPTLHKFLSTLRKDFDSWIVLNVIGSRRRMFLKYLLLFMKTICLIRTLLLVWSHRVSPGILSYCGDRMLGLEVTMKSMVTFVCVSFGSIILVFEVLIFVAEYKGQTSFITDTFSMDEKMRHCHFTSDEEKELELWIRSCRLLSSVLMAVAVFTMPSMVVYSAILALGGADSVFRVVTVLFWSPLTVFWIIRESKIYLMLMCAVVLDLKIIQIRIKSLNRRLTIDKVISLDTYIREFIEIRDLISHHNHYVRWILFMIDFVSAPGNMANLYSAIASSSILVFKMMNIGYSICLLMATLCMIAIPGRISSEVMHVYPKLMDMQVRNRLTLGDKRRLLLLAETITSPAGEIGFTNGVLHTFHSTTLYQYLLSLPTACMLFYSFLST